MPNDEDLMQSPMEETDDNGMIRLSGSIEHVIYKNEDNGYSICDLGTDREELLTIVGILPDIEEGDTVTVVGRWTHNARYGRQFRVEQCEKQLPADSASILRYLASGAIKGIGPKTAQRIVEMFGDETFDVMEHHPEWLASIPGITSKRAHAISEDFREKSGIRAAMIFFREFFGAAATVRIYKRWGSAAIDLAKKNPYRLCEEIDGIGFERADRMAKQLGLDGDSPERIASGILYLFSSNAQQNGHVCLPRDKAEPSAAKLLGVREECVREAVDRLIEDGKLRCEHIGKTDFLYDKKRYDDETYTANKLILLDRICPAVETANIGPLIRREEAESGMQYASLQRQAIVGALENGVMVLTGGPGTGKTTVVRALLHIFRSMDERVALTAPTGRAAKRLSEATSCDAKTIHRLLEYGGEEGSDRGRFHRNEQNLLEETVLIVDEMSMVDSTLFAALLRATKPGARLILIGDADQLPSVGAGNVLHDLIASRRFFTVSLTEIFRQAQESLIIRNAHAINRGEMPRLDVRDNDFFFLPRQEDGTVADTVAQLCAVRLPRTYGRLAENGIQVIAPSRKGETGTDHLNCVLQQVLNPPAPDKKERAFRETIFRQGDRVMQIRNNYDLEWERSDGNTGTGVFNGDIGTVEKIDNRENCLYVRFDDRLAEYPFSLLEELELAYAVTVHKSQGSEYPIVILPIGERIPPMLLSRNLLYTAVTRAQNIVIVVGSEPSLKRMVENHREAMRYTGLTYWLNRQS